MLRQSGCRVAATCRATAEPGGQDAQVLQAPWGRASTVSARNVLLKTLTAFDRLDAAVFAFDPSPKPVLLHEAAYADIEGAVDEWVRGTLFLLREVLGQLVRQGSGTLALVQGFGPGSSAACPPLEAMVRGAVAELGSSLLSSYGGEGVTVAKFETAAPETDEYLRFVLRKLEAMRRGRTGRRTFRFSPHRRLFVRLTPAGRQG